MINLRSPEPGAGAIAVTNLPPACPRVRPATPADAGALQAIYAACIAGADWLPPAARRAPVFAEVSRGEAVFIAEDAAGTPLGLLSVQTAAPFIHHLFVLPQARGAGVGRRLLAALRDSGLPPPWRLKCVRLNLAALRFYARLGWREVGGGESAHGAYALLEFSYSASSPAL